MKKKIDPKTKKYLKMCKKYRTIGNFAFMIALALFGIIGLLGFLRPKTSELEKRELASKPKFTVKAFLDGSYFSQYSTWYSDTFPMRDGLVGTDRKIKKLYGVETKTMVIGGDEIADDIPDVPNKPAETTEAAQTPGDNTPGASTPAATTPGETTPAETTPGETTPAATTPGEESPTPADTPSDPTPTEAGDPQPTTDAEELEGEIRNRIQAGLYVKDGAAYGMYYFLKEQADTYIAAINHAADKLSGVTTVYSILVPNNSAVMLSEAELSVLKNEKGASDEAKAISYYYGSYNSKVKAVDALSNLKAHNSEYLYFRTDHHWTQVGAYYAYESFCKAKGINPIPLSERTEKVFDGFLGTYTNTVNSAEMKSNPDTVYAYVPKGTNEMKFYDKNGKETKWYVITDVSGWAKTSLYSTFAGGDQPYAIIENPNITDGSSVAVVKESYGNAFIPLLVDQYQTVYIFDYRYTGYNVSDFCLEHKVTDLICINNMTIIGGKGVTQTITNVLK